MKTFLTLFVFLFSSSVVADEVFDFQIEGVSVGDNLLDYFSKDQILSMNVLPYKKKFNILILSTSGKYNWLQFTVKKRDKQYKIYALEGIVSKKIDKCLSFKKNILVEILKILEGEKKFIDYGKTKHGYDKSGKSYVYSHEYSFNDGSEIKLTCTDWSDQIQKKENWSDNFRIIMNSYEFVEFNTNPF